MGRKCGVKRDIKYTKHRRQCLGDSLLEIEYRIYERLKK